MAKNGRKKDISNVYFKKTTCLTCQGERLNELSRQANVHGTRLSECSGMSLVELYDWLIHLEQSLSALEKSLVEVFLIDLKTKISRLMQVGLGYLTLDRPFMSCSGGEKQRFRCAAALDSDLSGVIYILDEPTKGLHPKDTQGLFAIIERLKAKGNTVIMIEHDVDIIKQADWIIELGPQAGRLGGQICEQGKTIELLNHQNSRLVSLLQHPIPLTSKHRLAHEYLSIKDAHTHNLKHLDIELPLQCLVGVCGVSGSGKSTLIFEELLRQSTLPMIPIRQTSINRMKRSNVATYCDVYSEIRKVFAELEKAKKLQLTAKHFSFNTSGGRCENCEGLGSVVNHLLFFKDTETTCPVCHGKQFKDEVLSVTYENYSIHDILLMSVSECKVVMGHFPKIKQILELLEEVGLGYLQLGQSLTTLSGGEGQRLKLAKELLKQKKTKNIYLIDEPTSGLHVDDITHLLILLQKLVDQGNSVILVEHNTQCLKACDYLIELGPGGGIDGGECIAFGTIDEVMANPHSITAPYLRYEERRE